MRAVQCVELGGPEVLQVREVPKPVAGPDETLIEVARAGINFSDIGRRGNGWKHPTRELPVIPGFEVVGTRVSDGARVVGMTTIGAGGYAEYAAMPSNLVLEVPDGVSDTAALGSMVQATTAWGALVEGGRIRAGDTVAVMAAAGGLGSLALQLARLHGASRVIAIASTEEKRQLALDLGADAAVAADPATLVDSIKAVNGGKGVDLFLESTGGAITDAAFHAIGYNGRMVTFGQSSGASNSVELDLLMDESIGVSGYWVTPFQRDESGGREAIATILEWIAAGKLRVVEGPSFPVAKAGEAQAAIEARATTGKVTLTVDDDSWEV
ncbi:MAG TPA: zinc-binding dehydrogenase [Solirubrobacterales bacterium]|nr:zinc-binding dehydrogenase [Solirubrobacterales bacterium]